MKLNKLCIILPTDFDDTDHKRPTKDVPRESSTRSCGAQLVALIKSFLSSLCHHPGHDHHGHGHGHGHGHDHDHHGHGHDHGHHNSDALFQDTDGMELSDKVGTDNPRIFSYSELYIGSNGFSAKEVLGSGGFGRVYKAILPSDGTSVAVKCLAEKGERFEKTFMAELVAVAHLRHRNLVRLRGWCVNEDELLLVYDYMPNRSLDRILFKRAEDPATAALLNWERRRKILGGLAAALFYLHDQLETQIVHRDIKTSNVMLDSHFNARLGDFGLARWLEHELVSSSRNSTITMTNSKSSSSSHSLSQFRLAETSKIGGTIGYLPPESFNKKSIATAKSDVFSFGIVVLEVVSGRRAVDLTYPDDQIILLDRIRRLSDEGRAAEAGDSRMRDKTCSDSDIESLIHLGLLCTLHNPRSRPNMKWVSEALSGSLTGKLPPLPSFHSHPRYITLSNSSTSNTNSSNPHSSTTRLISTSTTATKTTLEFSVFVTANEDTIYATAENGIAEPTPPRTPGREWSSRRNGAIYPIMVQTPREISYSEIVSATNNFSDSKRVAELDFGTAYRGFLSDNNGGHHHVLIKRLGMKTCPALRVRFSTELQNLGKLRHRNLVHLRGWCTEQGEMLVVYDYSANRLLSHMAFGSFLQWHQRYNVIKSLASAVHYLHDEWDEQVIHRNITSSAVILDPDMNPRLGSFALAEFLTRNEHGHHVEPDSTKSARGIFGYMSPEYMDSGVATTMADVYSFGVVILELVSGQMAVDFRRPEVLLVRRLRDIVARKRSLEEIADPRLDGEYDQGELVRLVKLGIQCTMSDPMSRPSMREIVRILDGDDTWFVELGQQRKESVEQWKQMNGSSLSLVKRIQSLGIQ